MIWNSASEFFAMGGYALYVWWSFGICALVLVLEPLAVRAQHKAIVNRLHKEVMATEFDQKVRK